MISEGWCGVLHLWMQVVKLNAYEQSLVILIPADLQLRIKQQAWQGRPRTNLHRRGPDVWSTDGQKNRTSWHLFCMRIRHGCSVSCFVSVSSLHDRWQAGEGLKGLGSLALSPAKLAQWGATAPQCDVFRGSSDWGLWWCGTSVVESWVGICRDQNLRPRCVWRSLILTNLRFVFLPPSGGVQSSCLQVAKIFPRMSLKRFQGDFESLPSSKVRCLRIGYHQ